MIAIDMDNDIDDADDELVQYLAAKREKPANVLKWWYSRRHVYPRLSRMALDYLSIPGMFYNFYPSFFCLIHDML